MKELIPRLLGALLALLVGLAFLIFDREQVLGAAAAHQLLQAAGAAAFGLVAASGGGRLVLSFVDPELLEGESGLLHSGVVGLGLWGLLSLPLAAAGMWLPAVVVGLPALLCLGWLRGPTLVLPRPAPLALGLSALVLGLGLIGVSAPPTGTDELYYHLALPARMLDTHGLVGGMIDPQGSRPMALHLPLSAMLLLGGEVAPRLFHLALGALLLVSVEALGRRWLDATAATAAVALLALSYTPSQELTVLGNDLPAALCALAALDAGLRGRARGLALAAGVALSIKYTAGGAVAAAVLAARLPLRARILASTAAIALVSPWWLRNALEGLHPLFPFAGWPGDFRFQYLAKYGAGREALDMLALPWNAVIGAEVKSFRFLGRLSPLWLALLLPALVALRRPGPHRALGLGGLAVVAFWAMGPHWLRYLLPGLPLLALFVGKGASELLGAPAPPTDAPRRLQGASRKLTLGALALCAALGLPANWGPLLEEAGDRLPAATGRESRGDFLARKVDDWAAVEWANRSLPQDAKVALLFSWSAYLMDRPTVLGSVEDHVPARHLLLTHGDDSLHWLAEQGVTHVVSTKVRFLAKVYPFLSEQELKRTFNGPEDLLDELLLTQASLVFQDGRHRVHRLDPPGDTPSP